MINTKTFSIVVHVLESSHKNVRRLNSAIVALLSACILLLCSCSAGQTVSVPKVVSDTKSATKPTQEAPLVNDPVNSGFFNGTPDQEKQAWLSFTKDGKYRIAQPEDFQFPASAKKLQASDIEKARKQPYVGGDINRDGVHNDFAAIVVDKGAPDAMRFGLVIFTQPSRATEPYKQHFLYSRRDLSKTLLEWWSGGLAVREYFDDGTYRYCYVKWNKSLGQYSCEEVPR